MKAPARERRVRARPAEQLARVLEVLRVALGLGLTSFGGPIAHLGYFERVYVRTRRWLSAGEYANLIALCQVLPGPTSSQVGFLIGWQRAGWLGALAAWLGFTLPSALLLYLCALLSARVHGSFAEAAIHGLKLITVAVVAQALWSMARRLAQDRVTATLAVAAGALPLCIGSGGAQLAALVVGVIGGLLWCRPLSEREGVAAFGISSRVAYAALVLFVLLLVALPIIAAHDPRSSFGLGAVFYRSGALVFGGGHVVLPLLRDALVPSGWLSDDRFLSGYGLAQAVPGPLFSVAAYLGAEAYAPEPLRGALVAIVCIFLPGLLIAIAGVSLWGRLARHARVRSALTGINAAVVGILGAALYNPVWIAGVRNGTDAAIAVSALVLLERWSAPPILVLLWCVLWSVAAAAWMNQ
ncbi:MAG TPA: chromate efflux transporter [Steroidobacteraceae bacterium]|nr:chromate efflux transporter [Steroidobacteraceae bacterium]